MLCSDGTRLEELGWARLGFGMSSGADAEWMAGGARAPVPPQGVAAAALGGQAGEVRIPGHRAGPCSQDALRQDSTELGRVRAVGPDAQAGRREGEDTQPGSGGQSRLLGSCGRWSGPGRSGYRSQCFGPRSERRRECPPNSEASGWCRRRVESLAGPRGWSRNCDWCSA